MEILPNGLLDMAQRPLTTVRRLAYRVGTTATRTATFGLEIVAGAASGMLDTDVKELRRQMPLHEVEVAVNEFGRAAKGTDAKLQQICLYRVFSRVVVAAQTEAEIPDTTTLEIAQAVIAELEPDTPDQP